MRKIENAGIMLLFFTLAMIVYLPSVFMPGWDFSIYLSAAAKLWNNSLALDGEEVFTSLRGGYSFFLSLLYGLPGRYLLNVVLFQTVFCSFFVCTFYYFTSKLFGKKTAFLTVSLWLCSSLFARRLPVLIDSIWPSFILAALGMLIHYYRDDGNRKILFILSAIFLGISFSIKEAALFYFPLPIVFSFIFSKIIKPQKMIVFYLILLATILTIGYLSSTNSLFSAGSSPRDAGSLLTDWLKREIHPVNTFFSFEFIVLLAKGLYYYIFSSYRGPGIVTIFPFGHYVVIVCLIYSVLNLLKFEKEFLIWWVILLCSVPLGVFSGLLGLRITQNLIFIGLIYGSFSQLIIEILSIGLKTEFLSGTIYRRFAFRVVVVGSVFAVFLYSTNSQWERAFKRSAVYNLINKRSPVIKVITPSDLIKDWIVNNVEVGSVIFVENVATKSILEYQLYGKYTFELLPMKTGSFLINWSYYNALSKTNSDIDYLGLTTARPGLLLNCLIGLNQKDFEKKACSLNIRYMILSGQGYIDPLISWFEDYLNCSDVQHIENKNKNIRTAIFKLPETGLKWSNNNRKSLDKRVILHVREIRKKNIKMFDWYYDLVSCLMGVELNDIDKTNRVKLINSVKPTRIAKSLK